MDINTEILSGIFDRNGTVNWMKLYLLNMDEFEPISKKTLLIKQNPEQFIWVCGNKSSVHGSDDKIKFLAQKLITRSKYYKVTDSRTDKLMDEYNANHCFSVNAKMDVTDSSIQEYFKILGLEDTYKSVLKYYDLFQKDRDEKFYAATKLPDELQIGKKYLTPIFMYGETEPKLIEMQLMRVERSPKEPDNFNEAVVRFSGKGTSTSVKYSQLNNFIEKGWLLNQDKTFLNQSGETVIENNFEKSENFISPFQDKINAVRTFLTHAPKDYHTESCLTILKWIEHNHNPNNDDMTELQLKNVTERIAELKPLINELQENINTNNDLNKNQERNYASELVYEYGAFEVTLEIYNKWLSSQSKSSQQSSSQSSDNGFFVNEKNFQEINKDSKPYSFDEWNEKVNYTEHLKEVSPQQPDRWYQFQAENNYKNYLKHFNRKYNELYPEITPEINSEIDLLKQKRIEAKEKLKQLLFSARGKINSTSENKTVNKIIAEPEIKSNVINHVITKQQIYEIYENAGLPVNKVNRTKKDDGWFVYHKYADSNSTSGVPSDFVPDDEDVSGMLKMHLVHGRIRARLPNFKEGELEKLFAHSNIAIGKYFAQGGEIFPKIKIDLKTVLKELHKENLEELYSAFNITPEKYFLVKEETESTEKFKMVRGEKKSYFEDEPIGLYKIFRDYEDTGLVENEEGWWNYNSNIPTDSSAYNITEKGLKELEKINARLETRIGVQGGWDMFPDEANISELKKVEAAQKLKQLISEFKAKSISTSENKFEDGGTINDKQATYRVHVGNPDHYNNIEKFIDEDGYIYFYTEKDACDFTDEVQSETGAFLSAEKIPDDEKFYHGGKVNVYDRGSRPSPRESATLFSEGYEAEGQDGNMYRIIVSSNGTHRWSKMSGAYSAPKKPIQQAQSIPEPDSKKEALRKLIFARGGKIDSDILQILRNGKLYANTYTLPTQMSREDYVKANKAIEGMGGRWNRSSKAHFFSSDFDAQAFWNQVNGSDEYKDLKQEFQYFPTPVSVATQLVAYADIQEGDKILEPSAGRGAIADRILIDAKDKGIQEDIKLSLVELMPQNYEALKENYKNRSELNLSIRNVDFLNYDYNNFDKIIMNPPFTGGQDIQHVLHAYDLLKAGGTLVAVISTSAINNQYQRNRDFKYFLDENDAEIISLPINTFKESGTPVPTYIIIVHKPVSGVIGRIKEDDFKTTEQYKTNSQKAWDEQNSNQNMSEIDKKKEALRKLIFKRGGITSVITQPTEASKTIANKIKTNLTPEQRKLVRTPEFKAWFGDWENDPENSSKVVDENGEPRVVYHGTTQQFFSFNPLFEGKNTAVKRIDGGAMYFSSNKNAAETFITSYGRDKHGFETRNGIIIPCFIRLINPTVLDAENSLIAMVNDSIRETKNKDDGFIIKNTFDAVGTNEIISEIIITNQPSSIKLADGSNTTFDSNNTDIRFAKGGVTEVKPVKQSQATQFHDIEEIIELPAFKKWFKNSKVVDENGKPKMVFHGTPYQFYVFDFKNQLDYTHPYAYFAENIEYAQNVVQLNESEGQRAGIIPFFLNITKPFDATYLGMRDLHQQEVFDLIIKEIPELPNNEIPYDVEEYIHDLFTGNSEYTETAKSKFWHIIRFDRDSIFKNFLIKYGFDGVKLKENWYAGITDDLQIAEISKQHGMKDFAKYATTTAWCAFYPNQIKHAGLNTTFNNKNYDFRFGEGGQIVLSDNQITNNLV